MPFASDSPRERRPHTTPIASRGVNPILVSGFRHLGSLLPEDLAEVSSAAELHLVPPAHIFYRQEERATDLYVVIDGEIGLLHWHRDGTRSQDCVRGPHEPFGDRVLLGEPLRHYTAWTLRRSLAVRLPAGLIAEILTGYPKLWNGWIGELVAGLHRPTAAVPGARTPVQRLRGFFNAA